MSYDLLKTIPGAFSARTQFVRLYVKDLTEGDKNAQFEDYGLYTQVEQINKTYLRNHGLDEFGQLYKATMFEFLNYDAIKLSDDPSFDREAFEEYSGDKGKRGSLEADCNACRSEQLRNSDRGNSGQIF